MKCILRHFSSRRKSSHPARGARIEILEDEVQLASAASHPARGARIEMGMTGAHTFRPRVAPRKGCAD